MFGSIKEFFQKETKDTNEEAGINKTDEQVLKEEAKKAEGAAEDIVSEEIIDDLKIKEGERLKNIAEKIMSGDKASPKASEEENAENEKE